MSTEVSTDTATQAQDVSTSADIVPDGAAIDSMAAHSPHEPLGGADTPPVGQVDGAATVDAVVLAADGDRWLPDLLTALADGSRRPRRVVVVDTDGAVAEALSRAEAPLRVLLVDAQRARNQAATLALALEALDAAEPQQAPFVWLLRDDVAPESRALERLVDAARAEPGAGVIGPKYLVASDPGRLVEVGLRMSRSGRLLASPRHGEVDQGQYDDRHDTLAVSTGAALVRREVLDAAGALDPAFEGPAADVDLCWRVHRRGYRVVVVPEARVRDVRATASGLRGLDPMPWSGHSDESLAERGYERAEVARERRRWDRRRRTRARAAGLSARRGLRLLALTRAPWWQTPFRAAALAVGGVIVAITLVLLKRPRAALAELSDLLALARPVTSAGARWRGRRGHVIADRDLHGLFASSASTRRTVLDELYLALPHLPDPAVGSGQSTEPGPVADEALDLPTPSAGVHPGVLCVVTAAAVAALAWRGTLRHGAAALREGLAGGQLPGVVGRPVDLLTEHLTTDAGPASLLLALTAHVVGLLPGGGTNPLGTVVTAISLLAMPASAASAYLAGRIATPRRWPRATAALAWALLPTLLLALGQGRLPLVVAHVLLPLVVAGLAAAFRPVAWQVAATCLVAAAVAAVWPPVLALTVVAGVWLLGRRRPATGLALVLVPIALHGPHVLAWRADPWRLLAGDGAVTTTHTSPWVTALGWPDPPGPLLGIEGRWVALACAPLLVAGVLSFLGRGRGRGGLAVLALTGLLGALAVGRLTLARDWSDGSPRDVTAWTGGALDVAFVALLGAVLVGAGRRAGQRTLSGGRVAVVGVALSALALGGWAGTTTLDAHLAPAEDPLPDAARLQARTPLATRTLVLTAVDGRVRCSLVGREPGPVVRPLRPHTDPTATLVARTLLDDGPDPSLPARRLRDLAVGFVTASGLPDDAVLRLDTTPGLTRVVGAEHPTWRLQSDTGGGHEAVLPARVRALDARGQAIATVDVDGGALAPGTATVALAEPLEGAARVDVLADGRLLAPSADELGLARYPIPSGATSVRLEPHVTWRWWRWATLGLLVVVLLSAIPVGVRRGRRAVGVDIRGGAR